MGEHNLNSFNNCLLSVSSLSGTLPGKSNPAVHETDKNSHVLGTHILVGKTNNREDESSGTLILIS